MWSNKFLNVNTYIVCENPYLCTPVMLRLLIFIPFIFIQLAVWAQGCSDAGFCTMGAMRPDQSYNKRIDFRLRSMEYNLYRGQTTLTPVIYAHTLEFNATLNSLVSMQVKMPYMFVDGNLGQNKGTGDISLSMTRQINATQRGVIAATLGAKLPTGRSNARFASSHTQNQPADLPMYYQVTLGSHDLVAGASWINRNWMMATGIQVALTKNENFFQWKDWPDYPDPSYLEQYSVGRQLKRGTDVMFRVERNFRFTNYNFNIGLLPIYRITKDEAYMPASNTREKLDGTTGLALSLLAGFGYSLDVRNSIKIIYGKKLLDREVNPDGLTRKMVISTSYVYRF